MKGYSIKINYYLFENESTKNSWWKFTQIVYRRNSHRCHRSEVEECDWLEEETLTKKDKSRRGLLKESHFNHEENQKYAGKAKRFYIWRLR